MELSVVWRVPSTDWSQVQACRSCPIRHHREQERTAGDGGRANRWTNTSCWGTWQWVIQETKRSENVAWPPLLCFKTPHPTFLRKIIWWMWSLSSKPAARSCPWKFSKVLLKKSNRVPTFKIRSPQHVRCVLTLTYFHDFSCKVTLHHMLLTVDLCVAWHLRRTSTFSLACALHGLIWDMDMSHPIIGPLWKWEKDGKGKTVMGHHLFLFEKKCSRVQWPGSQRWNPRGTLGRSIYCSSWRRFCGQWMQAALTKHEAKNSDQSLLEETLSKSVCWLFGWSFPTLGTLRAFGLPGEKPTAMAHSLNMVQAWIKHGVLKAPQEDQESSRPKPLISGSVIWKTMLMRIDLSLLFFKIHCTLQPRHWASGHPWVSRSGRHAIASTLEKGPICHGCIKPTGNLCPWDPKISIMRHDKTAWTLTFHKNGKPVKPHETMEALFRVYFWGGLERPCESKSVTIVATQVPKTQSSKITNLETCTLEWWGKQLENYTTFLHFAMHFSRSLDLQNAKNSLPVNWNHSLWFDGRQVVVETCWNRSAVIILNDPGQTKIYLFWTPDSSPGWYLEATIQSIPWRQVSWIKHDQTIWGRVKTPTPNPATVGHSKHLQK